MDNGEPNLSSTTRVVVKVGDVNDNAPEFDQKTYNVRMPSNAVIDQKLFQVRNVLKLLCRSAVALSVYCCVNSQSISLSVRVIKGVTNHLFCLERIRGNFLLLLYPSTHLSSSHPLHFSLP